MSEPWSNGVNDVKFGHDRAVGPIRTWYWLLRRQMNVIDVRSSRAATNKQLNRQRQDDQNARPTATSGCRQSPELYCFRRHGVRMFADLSLYPERRGVLRIGSVREFDTDGYTRGREMRR